MSTIFRIGGASFLLLLVLTGGVPFFALGAEEASIPANSLTQKATIFFSPRSGTFIEGDIFEVPVFVDTEGRSINTIDLTIKFDPAVLQIVRPSGGRSIIGIWIEPPTYSNTSGTVRLVGTIPNGIVTESGLITTLAFKAVSSREAEVLISTATQVLANDGQGSIVDANLGRATYAIVPQPPGSVQVFSETHPFSDRWYNNTSPVFGWRKDLGVTEFSYILDDKPFTVPDNETLLTKETFKGYEDLPDGLWYFHIKAKKQGVWGTTTHFLVRIDTAPPARFTPTVDILSAALIKSRALVSFFTTDSLSGVDHYEVGVIGPDQAPEATPAFIEAESPYQVPGFTQGTSHVIVRAFDRAGNVQSARVEISPQNAIFLFLGNNNALLLIVVVLFLLLLLIFFLFFRRVFFRITKKVEEVLDRDEESYFHETPPPVSRALLPPPQNK